MPKIKDIKATPLVVNVGKERAFGHARGRFEGRGSILVEVVSDVGMSGFGEAWGAAPNAALGYFNVIKPFCIGRDVFDRSSAWNAVISKMYSIRIQNQLTAIVSGINMALYDLAGKLLDLPVYKLLGGEPRENVYAYASGGYFCNDPKNQLEHQLERVVNKGYPGYKIKIGQSPLDDIARVKLAREIIGRDPLLMVDVNGAYNAEVAFQSMRQIEGYGIHWMEEPVPPEDFHGLKQLGERRIIPIATGEAHMTAHEFKRLLDTGAVDVLMPDLSLCGGFDEANAAILLARLYNVRVSPHVWGTGVGLAAAVHYVASIPSDPYTLQSPYPALVEYDYSENPLRNDLLKEPLIPKNGKLPVPQKAGLGIEVDIKTLKRFAAL